jgi:hypothetical protein
MYPQYNNNIIIKKLIKEKDRLPQASLLEASLVTLVSLLLKLLQAHIKNNAFWILGLYFTIGHSVPKSLLLVRANLWHGFTHMSFSSLLR